MHQTRFSLSPHDDNLVVGERALTGVGPVHAGERYRWNEYIVQIIQSVSAHQVSAFNERSGRVVTIPIDQLRPVDASPAPRAEVLPNAPEAWVRAVALGAEFGRFVGGRCLPRAEACRLSVQFALSVRSILRLRARYQEDPRASALLARPPGRTAGRWSLARPVEVVIAHAIDKHYLQRERITQAELIERVRSVCRRLALPVPSPNAIKRRIAAVDPARVAQRRLGGKVARQGYAARPGQLSVTRPLALCQIDHTLMDVLVVSDDRRQVLGRPWLTVALCVATRAVLGIHLSMEAPSATAVALCLAHAASPKIEENAHHPDRWPMYGKPEVIHVDNGKDFRSQALQQGCDEHGITLTWRPVATPHYGGHIERLMGTLMTQVKGLPGSTSSDAKQRGDYDAEARAAMTQEETRLWLTTVICDYYHARVHKGLGVPPVVAWERAFTDQHGVVTAPPLIRHLARFQRDFYPSVGRTVQRGGIEFKRSRYWHPALAAFVGRNEEVLVRYHPRDLSRVFVRTPDGLELEVPAVAGSVVREAPLPLTAHEAARMAERLDRRFADGDALQATAVCEARQVKRNAKQNRPLKGRGGRSPRQLASGPAAVNSASSSPPPARWQVTSEEVV
jgi:putative transposase